MRKLRCTPLGIYRLAYYPNEVVRFDAWKEAFSQMTRDELAFDILRSLIAKAQANETAAQLWQVGAVKTAFSIANKFQQEADYQCQMTSTSQANAHSSRLTPQ